MISARRSAQLGLVAALSVMSLSVSILIVKGRDQNRFPNQSNAVINQIANVQPINPVKEQVSSAVALPR